MLKTTAKSIAIAPLFGLSIILLTSYRAFAREYQFTVVNFTNNSLTELNISSSQSGEWGDNRLPQGNPISPSETIDIFISDQASEGSVSQSDSPPENCLYDIQGVFEGGNDITNFNVDLCQVAAEGTYIFYDVQTSAQESLEIVNNTNATLTAFYAVLTDASASFESRAWGDNFLQDPVDERDSIRFLSDISDCENSDPATQSNLYDIRADLNIGNESFSVYQIGIDRCDNGGNIAIAFTESDSDSDQNNSQIIATQMQVRSLEVRNQTGLVLHELYASSEDRQDWGYNLLETNPSSNQLASGETTQLAIFFNPAESDNCSYDLEAIFNTEEGTETPLIVNRYAIDTCYSQPIVFSNQPAPTTIYIQSSSNSNE